MTPTKKIVKKIKLLKFQAEFVNDLTTRNLALVGGLGTGKTKAAVFKVLKLIQENPGCDGIGCEPTGPQLDIFTREMNKTCQELGIKYEYRGQGAGHPAYYTFWLNAKPQTLILVSAKNYEASLVGYTVAFGFVDEFDTIANKEEAIEIWQALNDRLRDPKARFVQCFVTSTPEGYHTIFDVFVEACAPDGTVLTCKPKHKVIQVSTYENIYLKPEYIQGQIERYSPLQAQAKIFGKFVNVFGQRVYDSFDRTINHTKDTIADYPKSDIFIGLDFNIGKMSATVSVVNERSEVLVLDEITGEATTDTMIAEIKRRYPARKIYIFPDTNGKNRSSTGNADETSIKKLQTAGFKCFYRSQNPSISKERVPAVNAMFKNGLGVSKMFVNLERCKVLVRGLEQQGYVDGKPDKRNGIDHALDALGYFVHYMFPIKGMQGVKVVHI